MTDEGVAPTEAAPAPDPGPVPPPRPEGAPRRLFAWYQNPGAIGGMVAGALVVGLGIGLAIPTGGGQADGSSGAADFSAAIEECTATTGAEIVDDGTGLIIDGTGEEDLDGMSTQNTNCILGALGTPQSVIARMEATRALDGTQSSEWDDLTATWTYHPDQGLDIIIEQRATQ